MVQTSSTRIGWCSLAVISCASWEQTGMGRSADERKDGGRGGGGGRGGELGRLDVSLRNGRIDKVHISEIMHSIHFLLKS